MDHREHVAGEAAEDRQRPGHCLRPEAQGRHSCVAQLLGAARQRHRGLRRRRRRLDLARRRQDVGDPGARRRRSGLRLQRDAALQRQRVDRHRQQPHLAVLRPDLPHLVEVRVAQRHVRVIGDLRGAERRWRRPLVDPTEDLRIQPGALHRAGQRAGRRMRREPVLRPDGAPGRDRVRRVPERAERGALGARRAVRRPVPHREVHGRRCDLVSAVVRRGDRGRESGLPAQRARPTDPQRLSVAGELRREHRREPTDRRAVPRVLGQPERQARQ